MRKAFAVVCALAAALGLCGCYNPHIDATPEAVARVVDAPQNGEWITGVVEYFDGSGVVGEEPPAGLILVGAHGYRYLYLRRNGSLDAPAIANYRDRHVKVRGRFGFVTTGPREQPSRAYRALDVTDILFADEPSPIE